MSKDEERMSFLRALKANEDDHATRLVFADWLDDHDQPEEADRMRRWRASRDWLTDWVRSINYGKWEYDEGSGDYLLDADGSRVPAKKDNLGDPHTLADAIEAGHAAVRGDSYCWGSDAGQDFFFDGQDDGRVAEWWHHWSTVTGAKVPDLERLIETPPFRCAC